MKNKIALILIAGGIIVSCQSTKSDSFNVMGSSLLQNENSTIKVDSINNKFSIVTMDMKPTSLSQDVFFDDEALKKVSPLDDSYTLDDGTIIRMFWSESYGGYLWETPPSKLYKIHRTYYPNKKIKSSGLVTGIDNLPIGRWEYYDESGKKTIEDKDEQLPDKFDYNKVYLFLSKEGYVDLVTGKGRDKISINYIPEKKQWGVTISPSIENVGGYGYSYILDGNTGKVLNKSKIIPLE